MAQNETRQTNQPNGALKTRPSNTDHNASAKNDSNSLMQDEIKKTWKNLSDEDVKLYKDQPDKFVQAVTKKEKISAEQAQTHLKNMKEKCGCSGMGNENAA
jgi:hypothetical protein